MKRIIQMAAMLILTGITGSVLGQNLLQNPGFESPAGWNDRWVLSTSDPSSSSALFTEVTWDVYEGARSVELSNSVKLKWTYLYSDSLTAPIYLRADKKYEVKGWIKVLEMGKGTELSIFWDESRESLTFYDDNPDPATNPDWFMVKDTIYPDVNCSDAYLRLGFRTDKAGLFPVGNILLDNFSVERIPEITDTDILQFSLPGQASPAVIDYITGTVMVKVRAGTDVTSLVPDLVEVSPGAEVSPGTDVAMDFSVPAVFTVTALDGITVQDWSVVVEVLPSTEAEILEFTVPGLAAPAAIDPASRQVELLVPFGSDLTSLVPVITASPGATVDPASGTAVDFTSPVTFTVTAEDGTTKLSWTVNTTETPPSSETEITGFTFTEQSKPSALDAAAHSISVVVPFGTDVTALVPTIALSTGAAIDPGSGVAADFTSPVVYAVTAQDGTTKQDWTVTVRFEANTAADITGFELSVQHRLSAIDTDLHSVTLEVPYGTDVTSLGPAIELSKGATIDPAGGIMTDFSQPVVYTVTAQDGVTARDWTVSVKVMANTEADIVSFSLPGQEGAAVIDDVQKTIAIQVPKGTDITKMVPAIELSFGAVVFPGSGVETDFTSPVVYTVTAGDGKTRVEWTVTVTLLSGTTAEVTGFSLAEQTGPAVIDNDAHTISIEVDPGTDLTALTPVIEVTPGASVSPSSGEATDFSTDVTLKVTAEDGNTTQYWVVTVKMASSVSVAPGAIPGEVSIYPNPAKHFMVVEMAGTGDIYIQDLTGRIVLYKPSVDKRTTLPVSELERGIYVVTIKSGYEKTVVKVVLE